MARYYVRGPGLHRLPRAHSGRPVCGFDQVYGGAPAGAEAGGVQQGVAHTGGGRLAREGEG